MHSSQKCISAEYLPSSEINASCLPQPSFGITAFLVGLETTVKNTEGKMKFKGQRNKSCAF